MIKSSDYTPLILFDLILYLPVNKFSDISGDGSSWVEPVLKQG